MKIGIIGASGSVGQSLVSRGGTDLHCDVTDLDGIRRILKKAAPDIVVHLACKSNVDWCEAKENQEEVIRVNVRGAYNVALVAEELSIPVVALSTDHIFSGRKYFDRATRRWVRDGPYKEDYVRAIPENFYGQSKLAMEGILDAFDNVKIVRTSNLFHADDKRIFEYVDTLALEYPIYVPTFQYRSFMYIEHFVNSLLRYIYMFYQMPKILHISGSQTVSWYDFFVAFYGQSSLINKKKTEEDGFVPRPKKAGLDTTLSAKLGLPQYSYLDGIKEMQK